MFKNLMLFMVILFMSGCANHKFSIRPSERHYVVIDANVTDLKKYDAFIALEIPILKQYDAYIAMDIRSKDQKKRHIIVSFPSREAVGDFVKSREFQAILPMNQAAASSTIFHGYLYKH